MNKNLTRNSDTMHMNTWLIDNFIPQYSITDLFFTPWSVIIWKLMWTSAVIGGKMIFQSKLLSLKSALSILLNLKPFRCTAGKQTKENWLVVLIPHYNNCITFSGEQLLTHTQLSRMHECKSVPHCCVSIKFICSVVAEESRVTGWLRKRAMQRQANESRCSRARHTTTAEGWGHVQPDLGKNISHCQDSSLLIVSSFTLCKAPKKPILNPCYFGPGLQERHPVVHLLAHPD